jgi:hypothetical protein
MHLYRKRESNETHLFKISKVMPAYIWFFFYINESGRSNPKEILRIGDELILCRRTAGFLPPPDVFLSEGTDGTSGYCPFLRMFCRTDRRTQFSKTLGWNLEHSTATR